MMFRRLSPARIISLGFAALILLGSFLLMLPFSINDGVALSYTDALYTSTSAVCVTGLIAVDAGDTFTPIGQTIIALLIQMGGLGVTSVGAGVILALGKKIDLRGRYLLKESMNLESGKGMVRFLKKVLFTTFVIEFVAAILSFFVFVQDYPPVKAAGISLFHSVAAFNNSGFDILGNLHNLIPYQSNVALNLITCGLIFLGGIGYLVIHDVLHKNFRFKKLSLHSKVVISTSVVLIVVGTILLKLTEQITWLGAFFQSVSARTAGFSTYPMSGFSNAGLLILIVLMFIGASPGSTGGGIKTSTFFVLLRGIGAAATNRKSKAFHYRIASESFYKASVVTLLAMLVVTVGSFLMQILEPQLDFMDILFEVTSAFGTVGLSTGITPELSIPAKILSVLIMYIGRLGPLTIATLWYFSQKERVSFPEGTISIG